MTVNTCNAIRDRSNEQEGYAPAMKNQSLRGELEVSMICVGDIEWVRSCQGLKNVEKARAKREAFCQGFMSQFHR